MNSKNLSIALMWIFLIFTLVLSFIYGADLFLLSILFWIILVITIVLNFGEKSDSNQNDSFKNKKIIEVKK